MNKYRVIFFSVIALIMVVSIVAVYFFEVELPRTGISARVLNFVVVMIEEIGYVGIFFLMVLESTGIPIPSEIIMPFSGYLVYLSILDFWAVVLVGSLANLVGGLIAYYIGFKGRGFLEKYGKYLMIHKHHLEYAEKLFYKYGNIIVLLGRNMPVIRTYISFPAGLSKMDIKTFSILTFFGSIPWNIFLAYLGLIMGSHWSQIIDFFERLDIIILIIGIITIIYLLKFEAKAGHS